MKKGLLLMLMLAGLNCQMTFAQPSYVVVERQIPFSHWASSFTINVLGVDEDVVMREWQQFITERGGTTKLTSVKNGNVELESEHVKFSILNDEEVTIFTRIEPNSDQAGFRVTIRIKMKNGAFYSSKMHPDSADRIKKWLLSFNKRMRTKVMENEALRVGVKG